MPLRVNGGSSYIRAFFECGLQVYRQRQLLSLKLVPKRGEAACLRRSESRLQELVAPYFLYDLRAVRALDMGTEVEKLSLAQTELETHSWA